MSLVEVNQAILALKINYLCFFKEERYQCAVTGDVLNNAKHCAVLKQTGIWRIFHFLVFRFDVIFIFISAYNRLVYVSKRL